MRCSCWAVCVLLFLHTSYSQRDSSYSTLLSSASSKLRLLSLQITDVLASCISKHVQWNIKNHAKGFSFKKFKYSWMPDYRMDELVCSLPDILYTTSRRKVFHDCTINELPPGRYMFVITMDNEISYGLIEDHWHIGVKHFHLAMRRPVVLAGELWLNVSSSESVGLSSNPLNGSSSILFTIRSGTYTRRIQKTLVGRVGLNQSNAIMEQCTQEVIEVLLTNSSDPPTKYHYDRASIQPHPMGYLKDDEHVVIPSTERVGEFCLFPHFKILNPFICSYYVPWTSEELMRIQIELSSHEKKWLRSYHAKHNDSTPTWKRLLTVSNGSVLIYPSSSSLPHGLFVIEGRSSIFLHKQTLPLSVNSTTEITTNEHLVYVNGRLDTCLITKPYVSEDYAVYIIEMNLLKQRQKPSSDDQVTARMHRVVTRKYAAPKDMLLTFKAEYDSCLRKANSTINSASTPSLGCLLLRNEFNQPILISQPTQTINYRYQRLLLAANNRQYVQSLRIADRIDRCVNRLLQRKGDQQSWSIKSSGASKWSSEVHTTSCFMPDYSKADLLTSMGDLDYSTNHQKVLHGHLLHELPPGRYTFVITEDNAISYGLIDDEWRIGVSHFHIAAGRRVVVGGELWLNDTSIALDGDHESSFTSSRTRFVTFRIRSDMIDKTLVSRVGLNQSNAIMEQCTQEVIEVLLTNSSGQPAQYHYNHTSIQPHPMGYLKDDEHVVIPSTERVGEFCLFPHFKILNPFICSYYVPWTSEELMRIQIELSSHEKKWLRTAGSYHAKHNDSTPTWRRLLTVSNGCVLIYPSSSSLPYGLFVIEGRSSTFLHKQTLPLSVTSTAEFTTNEHLVYVNGRLDTCLITKPYVSEDIAVSKMITPMREVYRDQSRSKWDAMTDLYQDCLRAAAATVGGNMHRSSEGGYLERGCALQRNEFNRPILIRYLT